MSRTVEFNDGEGLVYTDLNVMGKLAAQAAGILADGRFDSSLRLISGTTFALSGSENRTITLSSGYYVIRQTPADDDDVNCRLGSYAGAAFTVDARTDGTKYRRDIIQAKINTEDTGESESRDFKDATTGAISSQSFDKRRFSSMTLSVKKGSDQTSEALADANEPTPDAGYTKVYSILIPSAGSCSEAKVWDWHSPIGSGEFFWNPGNVARTGNAIIDTSTSVLQVSLASGAVGWVRGLFPITPSVGMRMVSARGFFSTRGDVTFDIRFISGEDTTVYDWDADLTEGVVIDDHAVTFAKPIWSTGLFNRNALPNAAVDDTALQFFWRLEDSAQANQWKFTAVTYVGY